MNRARQVATLLPKPLMLYDGDCRFCALWIRRWQQTTGDAVDYLPFQDSSVAKLYPELPRERLEAAVHFIDTDGSIYEGAAATFRALATNPSKRWPLRLYERFPFLARWSDRGYRFVAENRTLFSRFTRLFWGQHVERPNHFLVRWLFLRGLAVIYLIAFVSLWTQIEALVGKNGILPATELMTHAKNVLDAEGVDRFRQLPTLNWFNTSDGFLQAQCVAGAALALLLIAGVAPTVCLTLMWMIYLSLATVCREFLGFQWDNLLLEVGLLAIFFAPFQVLPRPSRESPPSRIALWLLRLLLFKLTILSGWVKLLSEDPTWRNFSALTYHYETQPLPTWIGWYAHQLPVWFQKFSCVVVFIVELAVPFLIFLPRRLRMAGAIALAAFQILILLTGNYTFFNCLTFALCLLLLDDFALAKVLPRKLAALYTRQASSTKTPRWNWRLIVIAPLAIVVTSISLLQMLAGFGGPPRWMSPVAGLYRWLSPFRSVNSYGLFAVMTTRRPEIIVEGSADGVTWQEYEFKYKPGNLKRRPAFVAPHQPRLDWQMWFAALGTYRQNPWFVNFSVRLLHGSPEVLALLEENPFPSRPPKYVRARLYDYHFTNFEERRNTGAWWKRELMGEYLPPISLNMVQPSASPPARP